MSNAVVCVQIVVCSDSSYVLSMLCVQIVVPPLPGKALKRQLPFRGDEGIFEESFIEERRLGLEQFINRCLWTQARAVSPVTQHYPALQPSITLPYNPAV